MTRESSPKYCRCASGKVPVTRKPARCEALTESYRCGVIGPALRQGCKHSLHGSHEECDALPVSLHKAPESSIALLNEPRPVFNHRWTSAVRTMAVPKLGTANQTSVL
jgi:hypothetical protein